MTGGKKSMLVHSLNHSDCSDCYDDEEEDDGGGGGADAP